MKELSLLLTVILVVGIVPTVLYTRKVKADTKTVPDDYSTIQEAIDAAGDGDTISVRKGTYHEYLSINKPLTLKGESRSTILDWDGETWSTIGIGGQGISADCTISGFTIRNAPSRAISTSEPYRGKVLIIDNTIEKSGVGVSVNQAVCIMINNTITMNNVGLRVTTSSNSSVFDNVFTQNGEAIIIADAPQADIEGGCAFYHNNFINNTGQCFVYASDADQHTWDDGYPSGGNYWSDHNPPDDDGDRIGDLPYEIDENDTDRYPLIYPFQFYAPEYKCSRDLNKDGIVNIIDMTTVARAFNCKPSDPNWNPMADMDINGIVNIVDISKVAREYGKAT